jgi:transposase
MEQGTSGSAQAIGARISERFDECSMGAIGAVDPGAKAGGRPRKTDMRTAMSAIFYLLCTGCPWRYLPREPFPPRSTVTRPTAVKLLSVRHIRRHAAGLRLRLAQRKPEADAASTPAPAKSLRPRRTVSSLMPNASAMRGLVQPGSVSIMARARSAWPRSRETANLRNPAFSSSLATTRDLPAMSYPRESARKRNDSRHPLASKMKPA